MLPPSLSGSKIIYRKEDKSSHCDFAFMYSRYLVYHSKIVRYPTWNEFSLTVVLPRIYIIQQNLGYPGFRTLQALKRRVLFQASESFHHHYYSFTANPPSPHRHQLEEWNNRWSSPTNLCQLKTCQPWSEFAH